MDLVAIITQDGDTSGELENKLLSLKYSPTQVRQNYQGLTLDGYAIRMGGIFKSNKEVLDELHKDCHKCHVTLMTRQGQVYTYTEEGILSHVGTYTKVRTDHKLFLNQHTVFIYKSNSTYLIK